MLLCRQTAHAIPLTYENRIELDKDIDSVAAVFSDRHQIADWQRGFERMVEKEGRPGAIGSTAELTCNNRGRKMKMAETITDNGLPHHFHGCYDMPGMFRKTSQRFMEDFKDWIENGNSARNKSRAPVLQPAANQRGSFSARMASHNSPMPLPRTLDDTIILAT